jgi:hypothetical protein
MLTKKEGWPEKMLSAIEAAQNREFEWGAHDCCMCANSIVEAMTGVSPAEDLKGYSSEEGAKETLRAHQGTLLRTMIHVMQKEQGCKQQRNPNLLKRGDVCMTKIAGESGRPEWAVGVCIGSEAVFASDVGLQHLPMSEIDRGWNLG